MAGASDTSACGLAAALLDVTQSLPEQREDVAVVERGWLAGGNIARNTAIIRSNYLWDESAAIYEHALKLWETLPEELDYDLLFSQRGVMNLAHNLGDVREGQRRVHANRLNGVDAEWLTPDDVKLMATPVLEHRLILRPEYEIEGVTVTEVVGRILEQIAVPQRRRFTKATTSDHQEPYKARIGPRCRHGAEALASVPDDPQFIAG